MTTRTSETEQAYRMRAKQIAEAAGNAAGHPVSPTELAQSLLARRTELSPSSFRQNRAALRFMMNEIAEEQPQWAPKFRAAIALLKEISPGKKVQGVLRTSQQKQKHLDERDLDRICHGALASTSPNASMLVDCLTVGSLTGARLVEWPSARFCASSEPEYAWELTFENGKNSNGRAHGELRTLRWKWLPSELVSQTQAWILAAREAAENGRYETLIATLESLMRRVTKALFPTRQRRPVLSSVRHAATARWKKVYVAPANTEEEKQRGLAVVAALLGHASDETATRHYARAGGTDGRFPVPSPDPVELARVRRCYSAPGHQRGAVANPRPHS